MLRTLVYSAGGAAAMAMNEQTKAIAVIGPCLVDMATAVLDVGL